jgi:hypothetical protein
MPQTLEFVRDCSERRNVHVIWLEYVVYLVMWRPTAVLGDFQLFPISEVT